MYLCRHETSMMKDTKNRHLVDFTDFRIQDHIWVAYQTTAADLCNPREADEARAHMVTIPTRPDYRRGPEHHIETDESRVTMFTNMRSSNERPQRRRTS
jgi:hypothetical protein